MNNTTDNSGPAIRLSKTSFSRAYYSHKPQRDGPDEKAAVSELSIFPDIQYLLFSDITLQPHMIHIYCMRAVHFLALLMHNQVMQMVLIMAVPLTLL